jgi:hypothetical protein
MWMNGGVAIPSQVRKCPSWVGRGAAILATGLSASSVAVIDVQLIDCLHECDTSAQTLSVNFDAGTATVR